MWSTRPETHRSAITMHRLPRPDRCRQRCGAPPPRGGISQSRNWDGQHWLHWDGTAGSPSGQPPPPADTTAESPPADPVASVPHGLTTHHLPQRPRRGNHCVSGSRLGLRAAARRRRVLVGHRGDDATKIANDTTSITTVPIRRDTGVLHRSGGHRSAGSHSPRPRNSPSLPRWRA